MYYPCFIYVSVLLETTTVYFPVSILWICLCVMYKASIVWTVDSLVGCMDPVFPFMIYVSFWCSKTSLTSSIFRYGCINSFSVWSTNSFISRCDTLILLFFVWCINTVCLNDTYQSYFCVICEFYISLWYTFPVLL